MIIEIAIKIRAHTVPSRDRRRYHTMIPMLPSECKTNLITLFALFTFVLNYLQSNVCQVTSYSRFKWTEERKHWDLNDVNDKFPFKLRPAPRLQLLNNCVVLIRTILESWKGGSLKLNCEQMRNKPFVWMEKVFVFLMREKWDRKENSLGRIKNKS